MSDEIWVALISALSGIIIASIPAYVQLRIAESRKKKREPAQPGAKINWIFYGAMALVVGVLIFLGIRKTGTTPEPVVPDISLSDARVEFRIKIDDQQVLIPAGGKLDTLSLGNQIVIDAQVTDTTGQPYPHELTFRYYFAMGKEFSGNSAPYLVTKPDVVTVRIEDTDTGEVITRIMSIEIKP